ncbi:MAG: hypothetical protein WAO00_09695 [Chthoniobacterales bacterium]
MFQRILVFVTGLVAMASPLAAAANVQFGSKTVIHFASVKEGQTVLMAKDDFVRHLSPFDRSARMKTDKPVSEDEYLAFVGKNVAEWTTEETHSVEAALKEIQAHLAELPLAFPATINLIKTTGAEEGNAAYTRGAAIILPKGDLVRNPNELAKLVCHELFHVLSRQNPPLREELYGLIGFVPCDDLEFPRELAARKITNPDGPRNDHFIRLEIDGQECAAIPVLLSRAETYDVSRGGEFFEYLDFQFLVVQEKPGSHRIDVIRENSTPKLVGPRAVSGFLEQVGRNTQYLIHPDEILADNFALLVMGEQNVQSPEILQKIKTVLAPPPKH